MRTTDEEIAVMRALRARQKLSTRAIGEIVGKSSATVSYWLRKDDFTVKNPSASVGYMNPPRRDSPHVDGRRKLVSLLAKRLEKKNGRVRPAFCSANAIRGELIRVHNITVSKTTVLRDLHAVGFKSRVRPRVCTTSLKDYEHRKNFAGKYRHRKTALLLFCDEKIFTTNDYSLKRQWVPTNGVALPREQKRWADGRVMVWGIIGKDYRQLAILPDTSGVDEDGKPKPFRLKGDTYIRKCLSPVMRYLKSKPNFEFVQDGAGDHSATRTMAYLKRNKIKTAAWPARSPDLNPIECLWAIMQRKVSDEAPRTPGELVVAIQSAWDNIPITTTNKLVSSFSKRCKNVYAKNGKW